MEIRDLEEKLKATLKVFKEDLNGIQAGQVSEKMIKNITICYEDGRKHGIMEVATVRVNSSNTLIVKPFTKNELGLIEKSIANGGLGVNTSKQGEEILITFPPLTSERREQLAKLVTEYANKAKQSSRDIRHAYLKENKGNTKEEQVKIEKEIKPQMDKFNDEVDSISKTKQDTLKKL